MGDFSLEQKLKLSAIEGPMKRYKQILDVIDQVRPSFIVEVGTWNGARAVEMSERALRYSDSVRYVGFDIFQDADDETNKRELNVKKSFHVKEIESLLYRFQSKKGVHRFSFELVQGDTRETMRDWYGTKADLVWLDGGHSVETIRNDYEALKGSKVILFDDYYTPDQNGACPDVSRYGCNRIVCEYTHDILPAIDQIEGLGCIQIARIQKNLR